MALLLVASDRIISRIEIRSEDASEVSKGLFEEGAFPGRMIEVNDDIGIRKHPDVTKYGMLAFDLRLVSMDKHSRSQPVEHFIHSNPVNLSQATLCTLSDITTVRVSKHIIHA